MEKLLELFEHAFVDTSITLHAPAWVFLLIALAIILYGLSIPVNWLRDQFTMAEKFDRLPGLIDHNVFGVGVKLVKADYINHEGPVWSYTIKNSQGYYYSLTYTDNRLTSIEHLPDYK